MFKSNYTIKSSQVDPSKTLNYKGLLEICEYMGMEDLIKIGFPYDETLEKGYSWVVAKFSFNIYKLPKYREEIIISTHAKTHSTLVYPRSYIFKDKNNKVIIEAEGEWALIDYYKRNIVIPSKVGLDFGKDNLEDKDFDYQINKLDLVNSYTKKIVYSDLDVNNHVNNTKYGAWIADILKNKKEYKYFRMSFSKEIKLDEEVNILYSNLDNNEVYILGKVNEEKRFEAYLGN